MLVAASDVAVVLPENVENVPQEPQQCPYRKV